MSYNGSGTFQINTSGQPVVTGTVISSSAFNALTADLATGLSTAITKDGQTATTVRIPFAQGINSSLTTDTTSGSTGSIYTAGGIGITKGLFVGGTATFSATPVFSALTASSAVATDASKNLVSVTNTGTGNNVLATSPTITTPTISSLTSAAATALTLQSAGTTAITVDTSQNVGIGTTSPNGKLEVTAAAGSQTGVYFGNQTSGARTDLHVWSASNADGYIFFERSGASENGYIRYSQASDFMAFQTASAERMRIDASGNVLVGTTATASYMDGKIIASSTSVNPALTIKSFDATQFCSSMWVAATTGNNIFTNFLTETSPSIRGSITYNRAGGLVVYNTTSDYRAKTVNGLVQNALSKVALLKPSTGRMNGATEDIDFFVAHELQEIVPSAVSGEKDAVNEDSTPKYQMVDKSALIPLLTAAIQEQQNLITSLAARIAALEA